jgi:hypothetical protein
MRKRILYRSAEPPKTLHRWQMRKGDLFLPVDMLNRPTMVWRGFFRGWREIRP